MRAKRSKDVVLLRNGDTVEGTLQPIKAGQVLSVLGLASALLGRRSRAISAVSGAAFLAASVATRFGIFHAGMDSADDPKYTVVPQRERIRARQHDQAGREQEEAAAQPPG